MNKQTVTVLVACGGALAYSIAKVVLGLQGELGFPGYPAPPDHYKLYDPVSGQLANAVGGLMMSMIIAALLRLPRNKIVRRLILGASWVGAAFVAAGVVGFAGRATGLIVEPGKPPQTWAAWVSLAVGVVWVVAWVAATIAATRNRPSAGTDGRRDQLPVR